MAIYGDLADLGVADLLYIFKMRAMTGRLNVRREADDACLYFTEGRLVHITSLWLSQRMGELLIHLGKITPAQLDAAIERQANGDGTASLGALLVDQGLLVPEDLDEVLRCQAEEILYRVVTWSDGTFSYESRPLHLVTVPLPEINVERLILDAFRQADDWQDVRARVPNLDCQVIPRLLPDDPEAPALSLKQSLVLAAIARGATTLRQIARETRLAENELIRLADELAQAELVTIVLPSRGPLGTTTRLKLSEAKITGQPAWAAD